MCIVDVARVCNNGKYRRICCMQHVAIGENTYKNNVLNFRIGKSTGFDISAKTVFPFLRMFQRNSLALRFE